MQGTCYSMLQFSLLIESHSFGDSSRSCTAVLEDDDEGDGDFCSTISKVAWLKKCCTREAPAFSRSMV